MSIHDLQTVLRQRGKRAKDILCRHYLTDDLAYLHAVAHKNIPVGGYVICGN